MHDLPWSRVTLVGFWIAASLLWGSPAFAQTSDWAAMPDAIRLLRPSCQGRIDWAALEEALRVELRAMGSGLADEPVAAASLAIDAPCALQLDEVRVTLTHTASGRSLSETIELDELSEPGAHRVLALGLTELVRARWAALMRPSTPLAPPLSPPLDVEALREDVRRQAIAAAREAVASEARPSPPPPSPRAPPILVDVALGVTSYPATESAIGELRGGLSVALDPLRLGLEVVGSGGWAADSLGDVALAGLSGAVALRLAHAQQGLFVEAGPRLEVGWARAQGLPSSATVTAGTVDALQLTIGLDARLRFRVGSSVFLSLGGQIGAALVGIDARAGDRRATARIGPSVGLELGLGWGLGEVE